MHGLRIAGRVVAGGMLMFWASAIIKSETERTRKLINEAGLREQ